MQELGSNAQALPSFKLCHPEAQFLGPLAVPEEAEEPQGAQRHCKVVLAQLSVLLGESGSLPNQCSSHQGPSPAARQPHTIRAVQKMYFLKENEKPKWNRNLHSTASRTSGNPSAGHRPPSQPTEPSCKNGPRLGTETPPGPPTVSVKTD